MSTQDETIVPNQVEEEFKPIHRTSATEIKNEKIDYIYKFREIRRTGYQDNNELQYEFKSRRNA